MIFDENTARQVAGKLLQIKAIRLSPQNPFTWASGWESPIYCDNRKTLSYPEIRNFLKNSFVKLINEKFPDVEVIAGVATAGIPHGALIADALDLPFIYVRSSAKGHGLQNQIEGEVQKGQKAVVIEDLISTGKSSLEAVDALKAAEIEILGLAAIFTYDFIVAEENFREAGVKYFTLSDYPHLINYAIENQFIEEQMLQSLEEWRNNPQDWQAQKIG